MLPGMEPETHGPRAESRARLRSTGDRAAMHDGELHTFHAVAFAENLSPRDLAAAYPSAARSPHEVRVALEAGGELFAYPFGALVFRDVPAPHREAEIARLRERYPRLSAPVVQDAFTVSVDPGAKIEVSASVLAIDRLTS